MPKVEARRGIVVAHALMLGAATIVAVHQPWGKTWLGRRKGVRPSQGGK
jgi:hypothetical protein